MLPQEIYLKTLYTNHSFPFLEMRFALPLMYLKMPYTSHSLSSLEMRSMLSHRNVFKALHTNHYFPFFKMRKAPCTNHSLPFLQMRFLLPPELYLKLNSQIIHSLSLKFALYRPPVEMYFKTTYTNHSLPFLKTHSILAIEKFLRRFSCFSCACAVLKGLFRE